MTVWTKLNSDRNRSLGLLALMVVIGLLWREDLLPAGANTIVDDMRNNGPNEVGLDLQTENYYEALLDVDREVEFDFDALGPVGDFLRKRMGGGPRSDAGTWVSIAVLGATRDYADDLDSFLEHDLSPHADVVHKDVPFRTNSWGHREDYEYSKEKPEGTFRIALVGSSNCLGVGSLREDNFETLVEAKLNEKHGGDRYERFEIINFSVSRYHLLERVFVATEIAPQFDPDLILVAVTMRDVRRAVYEPLARRIHDGRELHFDFIKEIVELSDAKQSDSLAKLEQRLQPFRQELVQAGFKELNRFANESGIPLAALLLKLEVGAIHDNLPWQKDAAEAAHLITLPIFDAYDGQKAGDMYIRPNDYHPTAAGHALLADEIYQELLNNQRIGALLLPE